VIKTSASYSPLRAISLTDCTKSKHKLPDCCAAVIDKFDSGRASARFLPGTCHKNVINADLLHKFHSFTATGTPRALLFH
jgi:hypothetical protein